MAEPSPLKPGRRTVSNNNSSEEGVHFVFCLFVCFSTAVFYSVQYSARFTFRNFLCSTNDTVLFKIKIYSSLTSYIAIQNKVIFTFICVAFQKAFLSQRAFLLILHLNILTLILRCRAWTIWLDFFLSVLIMKIENKGYLQSSDIRTHNIF